MEVYVPSPGFSHFLPRLVYFPLAATFLQHRAFFSSIIHSPLCIDVFPFPNQAFTVLPSLPFTVSSGEQLLVKMPIPLLQVRNEV